VAVVVFGPPYGLGRELVTGSPLIQQTATPELRTIADGMGVYLTSGAALQTAEAHDIWTVTGTLTVAARNYIGGTGSSGGFINNMPAGGNGATNTPYHTAFTGFNLMLARANGSGYRVWQLSASPISQYWDALRSTVFTSTADISVAPKYYWDGVQVSGSPASTDGGAGSGAAAGSARPLLIGRRADGTHPSSLLDSTLTIVSSREWSADEQMLFHLDPYGILEEMPRLFWVKTPGAPPATGTVRLGTFSPLLVRSGWFSPLLRREGWFSRDLIPAAASPSVSVTAGAGTITIQGHAPTATGGAAVTVGAGAITLAGLQPTATGAAGGDGLAEPGAGTVTLQGLQPAATGGAAVTAGAGAIALQGRQPTATGAASVTAGAGTLTLQGQQPTATGAASVAAGPGTLSIQGHAPTATGGAAVTVGAGTITIQGQQPTASGAAGGDVSVTVGAGTITLQGLTPTATGAAAVTAGPGAITLQGLAPVASGGGAASPGVGAVTLQGRQPVATGGATASPGAGTLTLQGHAPTATGGAAVVVGAGALTIQGLAPTATGSPYVDPLPSRPARLIAVSSERRDLRVPAQVRLVVPSRARRDMRVAAHRRDITVPASGRALTVPARF
jgi:hypothetical protein